MGYTDLTALAIGTINQYSKNVVDQITNMKDTTLLDKIMPKKTQGAGDDIQIPITYARHSAAGSMNPYGTHSTANNDKRTAARFSWVMYYYSIFLYKFDIAKNSNAPSRIVDLVKAEAESAVEAVRYQMGYDLVRNSSSTSAYAISGLPDICPVTVSTNTYGGLDRSVSTVAAYWDNKSNTTAKVLEISDLDTMFVSLVNGTIVRPDIQLTTDILYNAYSNTLLPLQTINNAMKGEAGYETVWYKGTPVTVDSNVPAGYWYMLPSKKLHVQELKGMQGPVKVIDKDNQPAFVQNSYMALSIYCDEPRRTGVLSGKTA